MQSAEEWSVSLCEEVHTGGLRINAQKLGQQIQLDAMKEGMRRAAELCGKDAILEKEPWQWGMKLAIKQTILTAAEQLTSESL